MQNNYDPKHLDKGYSTVLQKNKFIFICQFIGTSNSLKYTAF